MVQQQSNNTNEGKVEHMSNVAWFKLAELVSRGEKEKALTFFRLLSHSFDDRAYVLQLEGDILWSLENKKALEKYSQAAFLYQKENKLVSAVSVYEHLLTLEPHNPDFLITSIPYYVELDWPEKFTSRFVELINLYEQKEIEQDSILALVKNVLEVVNESESKDRQQWVLKEFEKIIKIMPEDLAESIQDYL